MIFIRFLISCTDLTDFVIHIDGGYAALGMEQIKSQISLNQATGEFIVRPHHLTSLSSCWPSV